MRRIYLDYNATTPVRSEVRDAVLPFLNELFGNPSSRHLEGRQVKTKIEAARDQVAKAIGAEPERIIFNAGATEGNVTVLRGYQLNYKEKKGRNHIIISAVEHPCIYDTAKKMAGEGYEVSFVPVDNDGNLDLDHLKKSIKETTGLISVMTVNNETGVLYPVKDIAKIAHEKGILFHTDAAQAIGKLPFDVKNIDADFVTLSGHKCYAPKGIGALYIKKGKRLDPLLTGGHQERNLRAGTENVIGMVALGKALELATGEMSADRERIGTLRDQFEARVLAEVPYARRNGAAGNRIYTTSNISFRFVEGEAIQLKLDYHGIAVSTGSACSSGTLDPSHVITAMCHDDEDAHSSIRFSFGKYSIIDDVGYTVDRIKEVIAQLRSFSPLYDKFMNSKEK